MQSLSEKSIPVPGDVRGRLGWLQAIAVVALMVCAAVLASTFTPRERLAALNSDLLLEDAVPRQFKGWRLDEGQVAAVVNPQQAELLQSLYSQNLSRIYIDEQGQRVMLSIAYGGTQGGGLELHRPEVCYVAQGFTLQRTGRDTMHSPEVGHPIPLQRLMSQQRARHEPITYWMRVGDDVMVSGLSQQLSRIRQGLLGRIPDGVLFRVSSISSDPAAGYALQDRFVQDLLASSSPQLRRFLAGPVSGEPRHDKTL